jgi:hypothetical protein
MRYITGRGGKIKIKRRLKVNGVECRTKKYFVSYRCINKNSSSLTQGPMADFFFVKTINLRVP